MTYDPTFAKDFGIDRTTNIIEQIRRDVVERNESRDIFIAQRRGAGKSTVAIRLAMLLDPNFTLDHVCFTVSKFVDLLTTRQRPGTVLVFDDLGTQEGGSSRKWQRGESQDLADIMQLNRTDGIITIATSLELDRGEKRLRAGFSIMIDPGDKMSDADTNGHGLASRIKLREKIVDVFDGSVKWQYWRYASGGRIVAIDISHPPADFWINKYKAMRDEFLTGVKKRQKDTDDKAANKRKLIADAAASLNIREQSVNPHMSALKWLYGQGAVSFETGVSSHDLHDAIKLCFHSNGTTDSGPRSHTGKWRKSGLADSRRAAFGGDSNWWLTAKGIKLIQSMA